MAWEQLDVNKPHLVYIILGGYTTIFMLCSSIIKEKLYIGEATVATVVGIIFGPIAADLINPLSWGNTDQITLEFARIILVVQCFAVGVELPKQYMNRHWRSVAMLLVPVMGTGWIVVTLVVWWMFHDILDFKASLCVAACVTATDPVLASSVVGKGKFAKRVPKHLRDVLSAESGCNDGMAFPFIYLALYVIRYYGESGTIVYHWVVYTILYECLFGTVYGVLVGYAARRMIRFAHERDYIDRESFLVFYFVLALFCAGSGSILGIDDLLVGFAAGVGFSNDGWFQEKTEESHVSNVIDLLLNLAFFVYLGTIIPWSSFNDPSLGLPIWKLIVLAVFVLLFRRIPIMMLLKPFIPDVKTWREALFAGHFGPIGVGAIFVAVLARAELENGGTTPETMDDVDKTNPNYKIIEVIWPITVWLVLMSIVVHGSSIAVFTLGKRINTLQLTFSYTTHLEDGATWMNRLPRIQSRKSSISRPISETELDEKLPGGDLGSPGDGLPVSPLSAIPRDFLRRHGERSDSAGGSRSRSTSRARTKRHRKSRKYPSVGGPVSESAITPASQLRGRRHEEAEVDVYREGDDIMVEDEDGNVLETVHSPETTNAEAVKEVKKDIEEGDLVDGDRISGVEEKKPRRGRRHSKERRKERAANSFDPVSDIAQSPAPGSSSWWRRGSTQLQSPDIASSTNAGEDPEHSARKRGPARAYTFGNTVIVEDEDGEVIKQYQIPSGPAAEAASNTPREGLLSKLLGRRGAQAVSSSRPQPQPVQDSTGETQRQPSTTGDMISAAAAATGVDRNELERRLSHVLREPDDDEDRIRFTIEGENRRLKKDEFLNELVRIETNRQKQPGQGPSTDRRPSMSARVGTFMGVGKQPGPPAMKERRESDTQSTDTVLEPDDGGNLGRMSTLDPSQTNTLTPAQTHESIGDDRQNVPTLQRPVADTLLSHFAFVRGGRETAAQRRRRDFVSGAPAITEDDDDNEPTGSDSLPSSSFRSRMGAQSASRVPPNARTQDQSDDEEETAAERRRRLAALGSVRRGSRGSPENDAESESPSESDTTESEDDGTGLGFRRLPPLSSSSTSDRVSRSRASASGGDSSASEQRSGASPRTHHGPAMSRSAANTAGSNSDAQRASTGMRLRWGADVGRRPPQ